MKRKTTKENKVCRGNLPCLNTPFMHLFPSMTIDYDIEYEYDSVLYYKAFENTIYVQIAVFKIKDAAKISKIGN